jgi:hypothetical protein
MATQSADSPNPDYDFIFKGSEKPKKSFSLPSGGPKTVLVLLVSLGVVLILVVVFAALLKPKAGGSQDLVNISARAQEIVRVSKVVEPLTQNSDTKGLVATTEAALSSDQAQLSAYLSKNGIKTDAKSLAIYTDKTTDSQMQTAAQNNSLDSTYSAYLKKALTDYKDHLSSAFPTVPVTAKNILSAAFKSSQTLLAAPQVASASGS